MQRVKLQRGMGGDQGTPGRVTCESGWDCLSLELPDRENRVGRSRIPAGIYTCLWGWSPHFRGWYWRVEQVPGRVGVLLHAGNRAGDVEKNFKSDVLGCILLGKVFGRLQGQLAIFMSRVAVDEFNKQMAGETRFVLEVIDYADSNS